MKILVAQTAFIGDVILATSLAETIHQLAPKAQVDFLVRKGNEGLLKNNPKVSRVHVWDKKRKFRSLFSTLLKIRKEKYDAVLNIQRFLNSGILTGLSGAKQRVGFSENPASFLFTHRIQHKIPHRLENGEILHEIQRNAQLLTPLLENFNIMQARRPQLYFDGEIENKISEIVKGEKSYAVLAPTSVWFTKQWSDSKWKELTKALSSEMKLFFIGAPADSDAINKIIGATSNCQNLAGKLSLLESARLMRDAARVFVNDSAPLHLASSVNAKTTAIFCSTIPEFGYTPLSDDSIVVTRRPKLDCQPCGLHGKKRCPLGHFKCSLEISAEEVAATARSKPRKIFHFALGKDLEEARQRGFYSCASLASEGFIHLSFEEQVESTGKAHCSGLEDLHLLSIDPDKLVDLRIENGFPHTYGVIALDAILDSRPIRF